MGNTRKIIMDMDPGHDDAMALIVAASSPKLEIMAITTVSGNAPVEKTTRNARRICDLIHLQQVPIYKGASRPLLRAPEAAETIHGESGLDGPELSDNPEKTVEKEHAVDAIIHIIEHSESPVTLVPTGPLTNIALALIKEPGIAGNIEEIVLMGGGTFGNWTPAAEFNIYADAEAAKVVFESGISIAMFGLDVTHQALITPEIQQRISTSRHPAGRFVFDLLDFFMEAYKNTFRFEGAPLHDVCTVAYLIDSGMFTMEHVHVGIETRGEYTYGATAVDLLHVTGTEPNVWFAGSLQVDRLWKLIKEAVDSYEK
ncbi:inosine-uridine nucleoside N-ribohydrolase [Sinobaca qinghaiensis]|uniref:Inosine-uridine nucleoside N-ribohydrolase n=1 Tax=Sinobaca qinghaiensis TaxID=342944 RepID=A0A419V6P5_9BACL|nr:nucleoside hydrolase [Sinobaca qinghaiensis]RKD75547.1 inosine-uridine nucleoside N-ribohydrolase [Sinobaca qinghaiensis]